MEPILGKRKCEDQDSESQKKRKKITTIEDFIEFAQKYNGCNLDKDKLLNCIKPLRELQNVIGMEKLKKDIIKKILYYMCGFHLVKNEKEGKMTIGEGEYMNIVLVSDPGMGKTMVAHIIAKIYSAIGVLSKGHITEAKKTDFVAEYIGHSESRTLKLLNNCKGGILFFDESYSMGSKDKECPFAKGAIDMLNPFLSENKGDFCMIIAGYEEDLERNFFSLNKGLKSRFPTVFKIESYSDEEMLELFKRMVNKMGWKIENTNIPTKSFFSNNKAYFPYFGRDIENFIKECKVAHLNRVFGLSSNVYKILTSEDITEGFETYKKNKNIKEEIPESVRMMYM